MASTTYNITPPRNEFKRPASAGSDTMSVVRTGTMNNWRGRGATSSRTRHVPDMTSIMAWPTTTQALTPRQISAKKEAPVKTISGAPVSVGARAVRSFAAMVDSSAKVESMKVESMMAHTPPAVWPLVKAPAKTVAKAIATETVVAEVPASTSGDNTVGVPVDETFMDDGALDRLEARLTTSTAPKKEGGGIGVSPAKKRNKNKPKKLHLDEYHDQARVTEAPKKAVVSTHFDERVVRPIAAGAINPSMRGTQYVRVQGVADKILFSQRTVSNFTESRGSGSDRPIADLASSMFLEFRQEEGTLDVVRMRDGSLISCDNRRLLIAKRIGRLDRLFGISIRIHQAVDNVPDYFQFRFGGARTWGDAVLNRMNKGVSATSPRRTTGYAEEPQLLQFGGAPDTEGVKIAVVRVDLSALDAADKAAIDRTRKEGLYIRI